MQLAVVTAALGKARREANQKLAGTKYGPAFEVETEPLTAEDPRAFLFSADGQYLGCGTGKSAWAFRWRTLLASGVKPPPPLYRYRPESKASAMPMAFLMPTDFSAGVGALAYDAQTNCALLGCGDGVVRTMDLASGDVSTLLTVPGGNLIQRIALSADGSLLSTVDVSMHDMQNQMAAMMGGSPLAAFAIVKASEVLIGKCLDGAKLSARNILAGEVAKVHDGAVNSEVVVRLPGGTEVVASITKESVKILGFKSGDKVSAIVKASN